MNTTTYHLPVTVNGDTRVVEFRARGDIGAVAYCDPVFAARIGSGDKVHRARVAAVRLTSPQAANLFGYQPSQVHILPDGTTWAVKTTTTVRNRQATVVGWADTYQASPRATAQRYYGSI